MGQGDMIAKANPLSLRRILHNSQTSHRTRGNRHQHYLYDVSSRFAPEAIEPTTVNELTLVLFLDKTPHVTWRDFAEKLNIIIRMKLCHFAFRRRFGTLSINKLEENHDGRSGKNISLSRALTNISILL